MDYIRTSMTKKRIKDTLLKHYKTQCGGDVDRELVEYDCSGENWETKLFVLAGSPPKGYALYMKDKYVLILLDKNGKRFKEYKLMEENIN